MISININETRLNEDEWGFYVDIENINFNNSDNYKKMREKYDLNKNKFNPNLECIAEEYEYYLNQQKKEINTSNEVYNNNNNKMCCVTKLGSTTLLTLLITYFVFCIVV